jgi:hypothetical protein
MKDKIVIYVGRRAEFEDWCRKTLGVSASRAEENGDAIGIHYDRSRTKLRGRSAKEVLIIDREDPLVSPHIDYDLLKRDVFSIKLAAS